MQLQLVIGNVSLPQLIRLQKLFSPATSTHCMHHFRFTVQQCVCVRETVCERATCAARPLDTPFDLLRRPVVSAMSVGSAPFD